MNLKNIIREELENSIPVPHQLRESDLQWIEDIDPDNTHISDLKLGQVVMVNCPKFSSFKNRKFTVDEIALPEKGNICVHFKEMDKIKYPFGTDREPNIPGMTMCEHLGCSFKLINKEINESNDMQWIEDVSPSDLYVGVRFRW